MLKRGLGQQAADVLRESILSGDLSPGQQITEESLSTEFGVSRGTIRSAIQILVYEGIIHYEPYKGNYIQPLSAHDAWEIYTLRNALEALATRLTTERLDDTGKTRLRQALGHLEKGILGKKQDAIIEADFALHQIIFDLSGHQRLAEQYQQIQSLTRLYMSALAGYRQDLDALLEEHNVLVETMLAGNVQKAEQLAKEHNTEDGKYLIYQLKLGTPTEAQ